MHRKPKFPNRHRDPLAVLLPVQLATAVLAVLYLLLRVCVAGDETIVQFWEQMTEQDYDMATLFHLLTEKLG